jgi:uncharacterized protein (DUF697 family)
MPEAQSDAAAAASASTVDGIAAHAQISKDREVEATQIVIKYSAFAFGGGVIPFPLVDVAAVTGIQIKMMADLSKLYNVEFVDNWGKSVLSALMGGVVPHVLTVGAFGSLVKAIPILGSAVGFATMSILSASATYAIGKVFVQHFESGGSFLDFDAATARELFKEQFENGKTIFKKAVSSARDNGTKLKDIKFDLNMLRRNAQTVEQEAGTAPAASEAETVTATSSAPVVPVDQDVSDVETLIVLPDELAGDEGSESANDHGTPVRRQRRPRLRTSSI